MNLVGKILTVFILVMSIFFCAFAVAVYATHKNWREVVLNTTSAPGKPLGLQEQLKNEKARYDELKSERDSLDARRTAERDAAVQALKKLDNEYVLLKQERDQLQKGLDDSDQERRKLLAQMQNTEARLAALRKEVEGDQAAPGLRNEIVQAQKQREEAFNEVVRLTDEKHQTIEELRRLKDHQQVLRQDLDKAVSVLRKFGLKPEPELYADQPPVGLHGRVVATQGSSLVEISIGEDDGLLKGHKLEVYRPGRYVGRVEVVEAHVDKSVCQVVPGTLQSPVQKDDLVASSFLR